MLETYYPEMGEPKPPGAQIEARMSSRGAKHWYLRTPLTLSGRGVTFLGVASGMRTAAKNGWNEYRVTEAAFQAICKTHHVATEALL